MKAEIFKVKRDQLILQYACNYKQSIIPLDDIYQSKAKSRIIQFGWNMSIQQSKCKIGDAIYIDCSEIENEPEWLLKQQQSVYDVLHSHIKSISPILQQKTCYLPKESESNTKQQKIQRSPALGKILVYNRNVESMSIMPACRLSLLILHHNLSKFVDILMGGFESYLQNNSQLSIMRVYRHGSQPQNKHKIIINYNELQAMIPTAQLVDTRTISQHLGLTSGYSYWNLKGRIPNSIYHGGAKSKGNCEVKQYSPSGQFLSMWRKQQIDTNKPIILYCGTGWRASQIMVYAFLNGVTNISLYSNGWIEWSKLNFTKIKQMSASNSQSTCKQLMGQDKQEKQQNSGLKNIQRVCCKRR